MPSAPIPEAGRGSQQRVPFRLVVLAAGIGLLFWLSAAARHALLQSNAYDLGLFDQWAWLVSQGLPPISSMEEVHVLADHGAWMLYIAGGVYRLLPSVQWLLASQALALSLTALPIWWLARQAGLPPRRCWLICGLWWLQPVVFNANLFDFHPETWVMPAFAMALWAERGERPRLWLALLLLMLGARDGLVLITGGMALDLACRRRWRWAGAAAALSVCWFLLLSRWLYPWLRDGEGPKAASRMFSHLSGSPLQILDNLDWAGGSQYLLLLCLPCILFWRRRSLPTLLIAVPLVLVNLLSASASYRSLVHHYSLPLAVVAVVAAIDAAVIQDQNNDPVGRRQRAVLVGWVVLCWLALAKPWFFTGPYLSRLGMLSDVAAAINRIPPTARVLTSSYIVPHISQRQRVAFPKKKAGVDVTDTGFNIVLLNPNDPGWGSSTNVQQEWLDAALSEGWSCQKWPSKLRLCIKGQEIETNTQ